MSSRKQQRWSGMELRAAEKTKREEEEERRRREKKRVSESVCQTVIYLFIYLFVCLLFYFLACLLFIFALQKTESFSSFFFCFFGPRDDGPKTQNEEKTPK
jgi:ABC-type phosphate transport system permease subunit